MNPQLILLIIILVIILCLLLAFIENPFFKKNKFQFFKKNKYIGGAKDLSYYINNFNDNPVNIGQIILLITTDSINQLDENNYTPLYKFIKSQKKISYDSNKLIIDKFLSTYKININIQNGLIGNTYLHLAINLYLLSEVNSDNFYKYKYIIEQLLKRSDIDFNITNSIGKKALDLDLLGLKIFNFNEISNTNISNYINTNIIPILENHTFDHILEDHIFEYINNKNINLLKYSITKKYINFEDANYNTPLHLIIINGKFYRDYPKINDKLYSVLENENFLKQNKDGDTPLHLAVSLKSKYYTKRILEIPDIDLNLIFNIKNLKNETINDLLGLAIFNFKEISNVSNYINTYIVPKVELYKEEKYQNITEISTNSLIGYLRDKEMIEHDISCQNIYIGNIVQTTNETLYGEIKQYMNKRFQALYDKTGKTDKTELDVKSTQFRTEQSNDYSGRDKYLNNLPLIIIDIFKKIDDSNSSNYCLCILLEPDLFDIYKAVIYKKLKTKNFYEKDLKDRELTQFDFTPKEEIKNIWKSAAKTVQSSEYQQMERFHKEFYKNLITFLKSKTKTIFSLQIPCFELEKWEPMLIKNLSVLKSMNSPESNIKLIEDLPTYILIAHGSESTKLPIKLKYNEYVIMNCNPHTLSWASFMDMLKLFYTNPNDSSKIEIIEKYFNIPSDGGVNLLETYERTKQNFCVFSKKCPNLNLYFKHDCNEAYKDFINLKTLGIDCNQFYKNHVFEFPVKYSITEESKLLKKITTKDNIDVLGNIYKENLTTLDSIYLINFNDKVKLQEKPISYYYNASDQEYESTLGKEIDRIRADQITKDKSGFCLFINSCRF